MNINYVYSDDPYTVLIDAKPSDTVAYTSLSDDLYAVLPNEPQKSPSSSESKEFNNDKSTKWNDRFQQALEVNFSLIS
jgi:hypothetical protein